MHNARCWEKIVDISWRDNVKDYSDPFCYFFCDNAFELSKVVNWLFSIWVSALDSWNKFELGWRWWSFKVFESNEKLEVFGSIQNLWYSTKTHERVHTFLEKSVHYFNPCSFYHILSRCNQLVLLCRYIFPYLDLEYKKCRHPDNKLLK